MVKLAYLEESEHPLTKWMKGQSLQEPENDDNNLSSQDFVLTEVF
jgi:hypothetical protein